MHCYFLYISDFILFLLFKFEGRVLEKEIYNSQQNFDLVVLSPENIVSTTSIVVLRFS